MKTNIHRENSPKLLQIAKPGTITNKVTHSFFLMVVLLALFIPQYVSAQADNCNQAAEITVGTACTFSTYTNATATNSTTTPLPACGSFSTACEDVWFTATVPASGHLIIDTQTGGITDGAMAIYTGNNCNALTLVECDDDDSGNGMMPMIDIATLAPGTTVYIRFWEYGGDVTGTFGLCAYDGDAGGGTNSALCNGADPFCTGTTYDFPMGVNSGSGEVGPDYGCLYSTPNPVWYYLQVATAGPIEIYMYGSAGADIDFACWGPFANATDPCTAQLTAGASTPTDPNPGASPDYPSANMIDCSYDPQDMEWCYIPNAQVGEVYLVLITNYSNSAQNVVFSQTGGTGATDCSIVAPPITNNGPLCEGQTLQLTVTTPVTGATYAWTGPNGFTSTAMNPTIANVTTAMAGTYSLVITVGGVSSAPVTTTVVINPWVTPGFNQIGTVCQGDPAPTLPTSSLNGVTGTWSPATVSTGTVGSTTYTFTPDAGQCSYNGTMSVEVINCSVAAPCPDYANTVSSANQHCAGQTYYFELENTACNGFVSFNVVGNWGSTYANELTWVVTSNLTGDIIIQDNNAGNNANGGSFNVASGSINPNIQGTVFTLTINDSYGDGFNGTGGYIVAQQNGVDVCSQITGAFGATAHVMFFTNITISPATITITTPGGPVTQTVTNCRDFKVPVPINNSLFCTTASITLPWVVNCETDGSILASGNYTMTIFPNTPDDISDIVDISFDPVACEWVSNYQNDCNLSHLGSIFTITPNPNAPVDACEAHYPETFTLQYSGIPSGLACCNTAGPGTAVTYNNTTGTGDAVAASTPFGGINNGAYLTIPPNGTGGGATDITLNFDMSGYCFEHPLGDPTDFWVTIFVDGQVVFDGEFYDPATTASVTLDLTDIPSYDENSVIEVYVYPNTFSAGGYNTTFVPGVACNTLSDGEWTASYFNLSVDVTFSEVVPTPALCSYDANENKPCCNTVTTPDEALTICSGDPFSYAAWQAAVTAANSTCLVFSSDTPAGGVYLPDNIFPDGINLTAAPIVQNVGAYAYCDMNGNGLIDAGDLYTLLSMYSLTVNPSVTPTFTQLGPYCTGDTPDALPTISIEGITGTWSPATISTAAAATTVHTFTPDAGQCANTTTMTVVVSVCCPTIICPPDLNITACNQPLPAGATTLVDFVNLGGTISNATAVTYSDVTVNGCNTVTTRTYTASNASACTVSCDQIITRVTDVTPPTANALPPLTFACPSAVTAANINDVTGETDACGAVTVTHVSDGTVPTCNGTFVRTYRLTDACGNTADITQNITISAPVVTMPAAGSSTVACVASATAPTPPVVTDNCGRTLSVGAGVPSADPACAGTKTWTFTYTDCAGATYPWVYTYTISAPVVTMPAAGSSTVACVASATAPTPPVVTDNCGRTLSVGAAVIGGTYAGCEGTYTYTFPYTDCAGTVHNWVYTYTIEVLDFSLPADGGSIVACPDETNTVPTPPTVQDNCGNTITPTGPVVSALPVGTGTRTYTWTYTDCEGNTHDWVYTYTVIGGTVIIPPFGGSTVDCPAETNTLPTPPVIYDQCCYIMPVTGPTITAAPTCNGTRTYTWTYTDCGGGTHTWDYVYTVDMPDFTAPTADGSTVSCPAATDAVPTAPTVSDFCGNTITPTGPVVGSALTCEGTRTYTWTYTDCAGHAHDWVYTYTVEYNDFTMPANEGTTVNCPALTNTTPTLPTVTDNCGNTLTPGTPTIAPIPTCEGTRTYTYPYTDCEGNTHNWVYTYTVEYDDFTMPADEGTTVNCPTATNAAPILPTVQDNCGNTLTPGTPTISAAPACEGTRTYTYPYTDCEGNTHNWVYTYTVEMDDFTMPANEGMTVNCPALTNTAPTLPIVTDACGNTLTPGTPTIDPIPTCEGTRTYTYPYTDCEGNTHNWVYTYTVEYDDFTMPANEGTTVNCPDETNTVPTPPTVQDNCGNTITPTGPVVSALPVGTGTRTYTWTYTDCEGNTHDWVYTYTVIGGTVIIPPFGGSTVDCPAETNTLPTPPVIYDQCCYIMPVTGPTITAAPTCNGTRTYTWTYTDCGGGTHTWDYVYTVDMPDFTAPTADGSTVSCPAATDAVPTAPTVSDFCGNTITPTGPVVGSALTCEGTRTYTWTYTDCAGHAHDWVYTYTVEYNDFTMPANEGTTVNCPALTNTTPTLPTVTDNCGNTLTPGTPTIAPIPTCEGTRTYTYPYIDCEGNTHNWVYTYTVEMDDFTMPADEGTTVNCPALTNIAPTLPIVTDNCGNTLTPGTPTIAPIPTCEGTRTYTYPYTDCEGNTHNWVYTYTVEMDDFTMPANEGTTVNCPALTNTAPTLPTVTDACGNTLTPGTPTIAPIPTCEGTRTYTYPYTDCEGNTHNWVYTYTVEYDDFTMPANGTSTVSCIEETDVVPTAPTVNDACGNVLTPSSPTVNTISSCTEDRIYTFTYTDCEGNTHDWIYTYVINNVAPTIVNCPSDQTFCAEASGSYTIPEITATDDCPGILDYAYTISGATTRTGTGTDASGIFAEGVSTIDWTVTDNCGNVSTCQTIVTIEPLPVVSFSADNLTGCDPTMVNFTDESTGNITIWDWEFGDGGISGLEDPSHTYGAGTYSVTLTVTTAAGCQSTLTMSNYITISPNPVAAFTPNPAVTTEDDPTITFINQSTGATDYTWSFGDGSGVVDNTENPVYTYEGDGSFVVTLWVENQAGCTDSTSMTVTIKPTFTFYMPNTFSPNNDGRNETIRPYGTGWDTDSYSMRVYSRWGELVFSTTDVNHEWDGMMPDGVTEAQQDVYSVMIYVKGLDGSEHEYIRAIALIR